MNKNKTNQIKNIHTRTNTHSNDVSPELDLIRDSSVKTGDKYKSLGNIQTYRLVNYYL